MNTSPSSLPPQHLVMLRRWRYAAVALSALAGFIHILAAPGHFEEWIGYGMFFLTAASAQLLYALIVLAQDEPGSELLWAGLLGNAAIIGLWLITRTFGIPFFGPEAGVVERVGVLDTVSKITEIALLLCLTVLLRARPRAA